MTLYRAWCEQWRIIKFRGVICKFGVPANGHWNAYVRPTGRGPHRPPIYWWISMDCVCEGVSK